MTVTVMYLIWSNEHRAWWRPRESGYTQRIEEAGRYTGDVAQRIVDKASVGGQIRAHGVDPVTGDAYTSYPEVAIMAPETEMSQTPGDGLLGDCRCGECPPLSGGCDRV